MKGGLTVTTVMRMASEFVHSDVPEPLGGWRSAFLVNAKMMTARAGRDAGSQQGDKHEARRNLPSATPRVNRTLSVEMTTRCEESLPDTAPIARTTIKGALERWTSSKLRGRATGSQKFECTCRRSKRSGNFG